MRKAFGVTSTSSSSLMNSSAASRGGRRGGGGRSFSSAAGGGDRRPVAEEATRRDAVVQPRPPRAGLLHLGHLAQAAPELLDHGARVGLLEIDDGVLVRLPPRARRGGPRGHPARRP